MTHTTEPPVHPGRFTYTYKKGYRGLINYYVKQLGLALAPRVAARVFTYHGALVCESHSPPS